MEMLMNTQIKSFSIGLTIAATLTAGGVAWAGSPPDYDWNWSVIGDPGNRDTLDGEIPVFPGQSARPIGGVNYEFRMATTEVTIGQYIEFVQAYYPSYVANTGHVSGFPDYTGSGIDIGAGGVASIRPGFTPGRAANMSWEYAARYVNWLHNGKVNDPWAFETGAYDTSTFTENPDGSSNHQAARSQDARFWIPSIDEWTKAAYWDPKKNGPRQGGYWRFQNQSDVEPIPGLLPVDGGERNAGDSSQGFPLDVGSFPHVTSPWGLLDMAGGEAEFLESVVSSGDLGQRYRAGTRFNQDGYGDIFSNDIIGYYRATPVFGSSGLRLASQVPSPVSGSVLLGGGIIAFRRIRNVDELIPMDHGGPSWHSSRSQSRACNNHHSRRNQCGCRNHDCWIEQI